jgi:energy-coupling factor transporter transmembrane protein EcfT
MKYAVEMGSGAMIYIPSFIETGSDILKLIRGRGFTNTEKQTAWKSYKLIFILFSI